MKDYFKKLTIISIIFLFIGCGGLYSGKWATLSPDNSVVTSFENSQINPNFNYYISGSDVLPRSILGLSKTYTFKADLWKKIEPTPAIIQYLVNNMRSRARTRGLTILGCSINDENGKQIGIWYSVIISELSIRITENREAIVYPPNDKLYQGYDDQMAVD